MTTMAEEIILEDSLNTDQIWALQEMNVDWLETPEGRRVWSLSDAGLIGFLESGARLRCQVSWDFQSTADNEDKFEALKTLGWETEGNGWRSGNCQIIYPE